MNVACDYEAPMQMLTTEKYKAPCHMGQNGILQENDKIQTKSGK